MDASALCDSERSPNSAVPSLWCSMSESTNGAKPMAVFFLRSSDLLDVRAYIAMTYTCSLLAK